MTNALRHALPGSGDTRPRRPIRLGLLQPGPCVLCAVADPGKTAPAPRTPGSLDETGRGLHLIRALRDQWGCTTPSQTERSYGPCSARSPVPEQTRPRPVAEPGGRAEPASVNDPSPAVCRTDIGHWPVTSSTGHVWITIWCRYGRDRLPDLPAGHQATRICAGKWRTGPPGADPGTAPGGAPPSWVLAQFIHKLVHSPLHSRPHQGWRDRSAAVHAGPGSREGFSCRPAVPCLPLSRLRETNPARFRARPRCRREPLSSGTNLAADLRAVLPALEAFSDAVFVIAITLRPPQLSHARVHPSLGFARRLLLRAPRTRRSL